MDCSPLGSSAREGNGTPLQYSCLENPMDGGAWKAAVCGVAESRTWLSDFTFTFHFHALEKEMATHSSVLAWRIPGTGEPGGLLSVGSHRVGHDWSDLAAAAAAAAAAGFSWGSAGKNTGVGCHAILQGLFPTQGSRTSLLCLVSCIEGGLFTHWAIWEAQNSMLSHHMLRSQKLMMNVKVKALSRVQLSATYSSSSSIFQNIDPQNINSQKYRPSKLLFGKFPGGPVAETLCFQCRVPGLDPLSGNWVPYVTRNTSFAATKTWHNQIKKKKKFLIKKNNCLPDAWNGLF